MKPSSSFSLGLLAAFLGAAASSAFAAASGSTITAPISFTAAASDLSRPRLDPKNHWAVIVAGSRGYSNYRHQADAANAWQLLVKEGGLLEEQVILLSFDDVAFDSENPFLGQLFNRPNGSDVYVKPTYSANDVNVTTLLAVLEGNKTATNGRPVLESDSNAEVFIAYFDHGAPGLVGMPVGDYLHADVLNHTLTRMLHHKRAKSIVLFVEACESGSMFDGVLTNNKSVIAVTAANPDESSWGTYCPPDDLIDGQDLGTCLGDLFSISWLEDAWARGENRTRYGETLEDQFLAVKNRTNLSEVCKYGATGAVMNRTDIFSIEGVLAPSATPKHRPSSEPLPESEGLLRKTRNMAAAAVTSAPAFSSWSSREATIRSIVHRLAKARSVLGVDDERTVRLQSELQSEVNRNGILKRAFDLIAEEEFEQQQQQQVSSEAAVLTTNDDAGLATVLPTADWESMAPGAALKAVLQAPVRVKHHDCYRAGIAAVKRSCASRDAGSERHDDDDETTTIKDFGLQYLRVVARLCEKEDYASSPVASEQVERIVERACEIAVSGVVL